MKFLTLSLLVVLLASCYAKPTFDVIANILHDLVHDPNQPQDHRDPYAPSGSYVQTPHPQQGGEYYYPNSKPYNQGTYSHQPAGAYYPNNQYGGSYTQGQGYGQTSVYDRQGQYQGPPYGGSNTNDYSYSNGYQSPPRYNYQNRGY